jgi:hypothetical protein
VSRGPARPATGEVLDAIHVMADEAAEEPHQQARPLLDQRARGVKPSPPAARDSPSAAPGPDRPTVRVDRGAPAADSPRVPQRGPP